MFRLARFLAVSVAGLLLFVVPALAVDVPSFDGTWEGVVRFDKETTANTRLPAPHDFTCRMIIQGSDVHVFVVEPDHSTEVKRAGFHVDITLTNAVVYANDSSMAPDDRWVESWVFTLTQKSGEDLLGGFTRLVNNIDLKPDDANKLFGFRGSVELKRISTQAVEPPPSAAETENLDGQNLPDPNKQKHGKGGDI